MTHHKLLCTRHFAAAGNSLNSNVGLDHGLLIVNVLLPAYGDNDATGLRCCSFVTTAFLAKCCTKPSNSVLEALLHSTPEKHKGSPRGSTKLREDEGADAGRGTVGRGSGGDGTKRSASGVADGGEVNLRQFTRTKHAPLEIRSCVAGASDCLPAPAVVHVACCARVSERG